MITGLVLDVRRFSIHDGPGIRTTVFLKGCGLDCWWCHNPESQARGPEAVVRGSRCIRCGACVDACGHGAIRWSDADGPVTARERCAACGECAAVCWAEARELAGRTMAVMDVLAEVLQDVPFYEESGGGVTLSGGEPLLQAGFAADLLRGCKRHGLHTALDTCGHAPWETFERVRRDVDLFLYDVKLMDDERHRRFTGVSNALILRNLRALAEAGHRVRFRLPVIPGVNDDAGNLRAVAALAASLPRVDGVDLLPYHPIGVDKYRRLERPYRLHGTEAPTPERLAEVAGLLESCGLPVGRRPDA